MSAYVVSKDEIDFLVEAALGAGRPPSDPFRWWQTGPHGEYGGWRYLTREQTFEDDAFTPSMLGQMLVSANVASVSYRYPDDDVEAGELPGPTDAYYLGPYVYGGSLVAGPMSPGKVFAAIDTFDYQACEHPEWQESEAFAFLYRLRVAYCRRVSDAEGV